MKKLMLCLLVSFLISGSVFAGCENDFCVKPNPFAMFLYGCNISYEGVDLLPGDTIFAYAPDGSRCGLRVLEDCTDRGCEYNNLLRFMPVYGVDPWEDSLYGPVEGDTILFKLNGPSFSNGCTPAQAIAYTAYEDTLVVVTPVIWENSLYKKYRLVEFVALFETNSCCKIRGDLNEDGTVDIQDFMMMNDWMHNGGPDPICRDAADLNNDNTVDIQDFVYWINWSWWGGPAPVLCN